MSAPDTRLANSGLWGFWSLGNGSRGQPPGHLVISNTAGIQNEKAGLFGERFGQRPITTFSDLAFCRRLAKTTPDLYQLQATSTVTCHDEFPFADSGLLLCRFHFTQGNDFRNRVDVSFTNQEESIPRTRPPRPILRRGGHGRVGGGLRATGAGFKPVCCYRLYQSGTAVGRGQRDRGRLGPATNFVNVLRRTANRESRFAISFDDSSPATVTLQPCLLNNSGPERNWVAAASCSRRLAPLRR